MRELIILSLVFLSCNRSIKSSNGNEKEKLLALHENYRRFWLENDSAKVVNLFSEDAALIPPNNKGDFVKGKKAIGAWWFTKTEDVTYPITKFTYDHDTLLMQSGDYAMIEGISIVSWDTKIRDSVTSSSTSTTNFISVFRKENGEWKYFRQMWNTKL